MIKGLLMAFVMFAVVWLALWTLRGEAGRRGRWAPFDMREPDQAEAQRPDPAPSLRGRQERSVRTRRSR